MIRELFDNLMDLKKLVFDNDSTGAAAAVMRGYCFESLVHIVITNSLSAKRIKCPVQTLGTSPRLPRPTVTLGCTSYRFLHSVGDVANLQLEEYGIGRRGFPAVDGVLKRDDGSVDLLQVTINQDLKLDALDEVVTKLGVATAMIRIFWIVPETLFEKFPPQSFRLKGSNPVYVSRDAKFAKLSAIPQYKVSFQRGQAMLQGKAATAVERYMDHLNRAVCHGLKNAAITITT